MLSLWITALAISVAGLLTACRIEHSFQLLFSWLKLVVPSLALLFVNYGYYVVSHRVSVSLITIWVVIVGIVVRKLFNDYDLSQYHVDTEDF